MQQSAQRVPKAEPIPVKPFSGKGDTDSEAVGQGLPLLTLSKRKRKRRRGEIGKYFVMNWRRFTVAGPSPKCLCDKAP